MMPENIKISDYDYNLPDERIAKHPLAQRDRCKLLVCPSAGDVSEHLFCELPGLLPVDSMLVCNNTKVINARLLFYKETGAKIEIFCLEPHEPADYSENFARRGSCRWMCFVGNSKRWRDGELTMRHDSLPFVLHARRISRVGNASVIEFNWRSANAGGETPTFASVIEAAGKIPVPPYLNRDTEDSDTEDYQTVYSRISGSVAAPTAGLHFTPQVLEAIDVRGIARRELTLHVGAGTFQPVKDDDVSQHVMHSEFITVPLQLIEELVHTSRRVVAVGTTSVRTLESLYHAGCLMRQGRWQGEVPQWYAYDENHPRLSRGEALDEVARHLRSSGLKSLAASTRIIIEPGYEYKVVDGLVTNFHQPKSTLLLLVSAMTGDRWRECYAYAMDHGFRFLSYGDACLFL